jgi:hypothetical protein
MRRPRDPVRCLLSEIFNKKKVNERWENIQEHKVVTGTDIYLLY